MSQPGSETSSLRQPPAGVGYAIPAAARTRFRTASRGFTAIELMVVIAIIAVLIALLLPAIQQAREAARRTQCQNNLLQLGIALHNYHHAHRTLPPGCVDPTGPVKQDGTGYKLSWVVQILPFLDELNAYQRIDFSRGAFMQPDQELQTYILPIMNCPSAAGGAAYVGCHHDVDAPIDVDNNGTMFLNSRVRFRDITDGSRHTILLGEANSVGSWLAGTGATLRNMGGFGDLSGVNYQVVPTRDYYNAPVRPEPNSDDPTVIDMLLRSGGFGSSHDSGANFCFADGSIHYLSAYTDETILKRLANRHDGQLIGEY